jgi:hypothetical protein
VAKKGDGEPESVSLRRLDLYEAAINAGVTCFGFICAVAIVGLVYLMVDRAAGLDTNINIGLAVTIVLPAAFGVGWAREKGISRGRKQEIERVRDQCETLEEELKRLHKQVETLSDDLKRRGSKGRTEGK